MLELGDGYAIIGMGWVFEEGVVEVGGIVVGVGGGGGFVEGRVDGEGGELLWS